MVGALRSRLPTDPLSGSNVGNLPHTRASVTNKPKLVPVKRQGKLSWEDNRHSTVVQRVCMHCPF